jgi:hypothetical protein
VDTLIIAQGTPYETTVFDLRRGSVWAQSTGRRGSTPPAALWWHHTCGQATETEPPRQVLCLAREAKHAEYGLPYNFVVWPTQGCPAYYLNDVDLCWPHTYGHNCDVAIAAQGNYDVAEPPAALVSKLMRLADALATMWGVQLPTYGHRDCYPTACPGQYLYPLVEGY